MKCCDKIWKILAALVAVTATILVIVKFWDKILESMVRLKEKFSELRAEQHDAYKCEDFLV